ncbi:response regulator [Parasedimentitalea marina]|nr:response regulator transcription factor [Parasedimentitalea marina]
MIIVADDHPIFREGMTRIIRRVLPGTILEAAEFGSLLSHIEDDNHPTLLILDLVFPGFDGANSVGHLRQKCSQSAIIVVSMNEDPKIARSMLAAGANGYISKSVLPEQIQKAIADVLDGEVVMLLEAQPENDLEKPDVTLGLSPRHIDLLVRLGQGKSNKEIARELDISPFTVRAHMSALFKKLDVSTRASAAAIAALNGLV